jgi:uncharacterized protein (TIGR03435 family)
MKDGRPLGSDGQKRKQETKLTLRVAVAGAIAFGVIAAPEVRSQSAAAQKFEVISIKPSASCGGGDGRGGGGGGGRNWSPGRLSIECRTVMNLARMAYVQFANAKRRPPGSEVPIKGGPAWINSIRYDINANAGGAPSLELMSGPMMQALLEDRFQLRMRREARSVPVYELTVAKGGPKLRAAQAGKCTSVDPGPPEPGKSWTPPCGALSEPSPNSGLFMYGQTMAGLCRQFAGSLGRDVIDKTGITGSFDIHLDLSFDDLSAGNDAAATDQTAPQAPADPFEAISAAVQKLGLKLVPAKGPGELLVIDRVEKPSEN